MSLHASELNPVIKAPWSAAATLCPRTSVLKFAIVNELEKFLILFRFVRTIYVHRPEEQRAFLLQGSKWQQNVSSNYENNDAALNSSGYSSWTYKITTSTKPTYQVLLKLGNALCHTLNGIRQNNNRVHVEKDNLFWLTQSNCVWVDIVGDNKAMEYLLEKIGDTMPNMYNQNKDLVHSHFR